MTRFIRSACPRWDRHRSARVAVVATVVSAVVLAIATMAHGANFGSRFLNGSCCTLYGGRANIDSVSLNPTSIYLTLARVEADNAGPLLIQSGFIKAGSTTSWANCPNVASRSRFYEAVTPTGTQCNKYANQSLTRAAVLWSTTGSTTWSAWLDGTAVFTGPVGFGAAGGFLAGNEISTTGFATARFGSGSYPWARATQRGGGSYTPVLMSQIFRRPDSTAAWSIGSLPSPFTITGDL